MPIAMNKEFTPSLFVPLRLLYSLSKVWMREVRLVHLMGRFVEFGVDRRETEILRACEEDYGNDADA